MSEQTAAEIRKILEGPHEYRNGQYAQVERKPEPIQEVKKIEQKPVYKDSK